MIDDPVPYIPDRRGIFEKISPAQFRAVACKAQGFTDLENATDGHIGKKTISTYIDAARHRLGIDTTQRLMWAYYREYAPGLLDPSADSGEVSS